MTRSSDRLVPTPSGPARVLVDAATEPSGPGGAGDTLVLGHGAAGGVHTRDLAALAAALPAHGVTVVRVEQPWVVAGRRVAPAPARLDEAWRAVVPALGVTGRMVLGGRSAGARVACRTARGLGAVAVVALAFPLHPPGRPERSRLSELLAAGVPTLVVQGERDPFGTPAEFPAGVGVRPVPGADHGFAVPRAAAVGQDEALGRLVLLVAGWLLALR
jgi:predicted alpha/beta-hydrolase family hydrolase